MREPNVQTLLLYKHAAVDILLEYRCNQAHFHVIYMIFFEYYYLYIIFFLIIFFIFFLISEEYLNICIVLRFPDSLIISQSLYVQHIMTSRGKWILNFYHAGYYKQVSYVYNLLGFLLTLNSGNQVDTNMCPVVYLPSTHTLHIRISRTWDIIKKLGNSVWNRDSENNNHVLIQKL